MQFLPIVEREMRVTARQPRTWWRRVLTVGVALVIFSFVYLIVGRWGSLSLVGHQVFIVLGAFATIYALLAGPLATTDCLSRERREGTLGLLFLTDLRGYDVVLGKMAAASLDTVLGLVAALPLAALPFMLGGVGLAQYGYVALALLNIMFLSLAVGACASSLFVSGRMALGVTLAFLLFLTLGLPTLGDGILGISANGEAGPFFYMICPIYGICRCLGGLVSSRWPYWLNAGGMQALAWVCLGIACFRTGRSWRDNPISALRLRWRERFERWSLGNSRWRLAWRQLMLDKSPVAWLEGRDRLQQRALRCSVLACMIFWAATHIHTPKTWPDQEALILWPLFAHYVLCLWIAIQAPRRLADDKQSGALELLLCTPMPPAQIILDSMRILRNRFGRAMLGLLALDAFLAYAYFSTHGGWPGFLKPDMFFLAIAALVVFPVQGYCLARIGLYQGLVQANSLRATFMVVWKIGLLPWVVFIASVLTCEFGRRRFPILPRVNDIAACILWGGAHLLVCGVFLAHASWQLRRNFRSLAAQSAALPWWKRWRPRRYMVTSFHSYTGDARV